MVSLIVNGRCTFAMFLDPMVADHMTRLAVSSLPSLVVFEEPPISVLGLLLADKRSFHRS
ncbi:hypothetical protein Gohar_010910 [Gossypium harknessii]|uniref:Uncharacterized protein n=1 Tax=Gossypium harknessii TaxID=34285 RepID=A0A7J9GSB7_9ROSI|nr:hypothetical protein [Gossypium harknessii]